MQRFKEGTPPHLPEMIQPFDIGGVKNNTPTFPVIFASYTVYFCHYCCFRAERVWNVDSRKKRKTWIILIILLLLLLLCGGISTYLNSGQSQPIAPNLDSDAVDWHGSQDLEDVGKQNGGTISIPCFENLVFAANKKTQKVNLYNPEKNNCYFVITLIVGEDTVYQSKMIAPGTGFYEIEINDLLDVGKYAATIVYECYSIDDLSPMNGGAFHFDLHVK